MNKFSFKDLVQEEVKKTVKVEPLWTPIELPVREEKKVEYKTSKPRNGIKSLLDFNEDIKPVKDAIIKPLVITQIDPIMEKSVVIEETIIEEIKVEQPSQEQIITLADRAVEQITKEVKLEERADSFQQPNPVTVENNLLAVTKKLKFLEQAIGKISAHGPGSGEVNFLRLDDVHYPSWQDKDRHKILKFDPSNVEAHGGVTFGFLTGDQGPIYSLKFDTASSYTTNANVAPGLVYFDPQRDALEILQTDSTRTYVGLDNYIRFKNGTNNTIARGSLVRFTGSDSTDEVPIGGLYTANSTSAPLYIMGVCATNVAPNIISRAMLLGELEDIDASGNSSGEVWNTGDLLWSSPSLPGKLTNVRPTAPDVVVSVAAVMDNSPTSGRLLVRPLLWPRLRAGDFYSTNQQLAPNTDFAHQVTLSNTLFSSTVSLSNSTITVGESGLYKFDLRVQLSSTSSSQKSIVVWYKKNNVNVPYSAVRLSESTNNGYATINNNQMISLTPQDNVTIFFAVSDTALFIDSPATLDASPSIPSVQLTVTEPSL